MRHFLNNIPVSPRNVLEIGLTSDYTGRPNILSVDTERLILPREARQIILDHLAQQGPFEGIPYKIVLNGGATLEYYVDLTEGTIYRDYEIEVKIKKRRGNDSFFENADGLSFELMNANGVNFNLIDIPYLIIPENQAELGLSLSISLYVMTKEGIQAVKDLVTATRDFIEAVSPNIGIPPVPPVGEIISLGLALAAQIAYTIAVLNAIKKLAEDMFELVFPKKRKYKGVTIKELINQGCQYLGYTLNSTLLNDYNNLTIMPVPLVKEKKSIFDYLQNDLNFSFTKGYPTAQDTTATLGELIRAVELWFNAKTKVYNGVVAIERRDYWQNISQNTTVPALNVQDTRQNEYSLNTEEAFKRTYIHYRVDYSDVHSVDFFDPTDAEFSTEPTNVINQDLVSIRGLNDVNIPFALGVRKPKLNFIEKLAKAFFQVVDGITGVFGGGTNFVADIQNRVGVTQLSQQYYSITKILWNTGGGRQPENYTDFIKAGVIYEKFHKINEINQNGYKIFNNVPTRLTDEDFLTLLDNNFVYIDGVLCEILTINYVDEESKAVITYKEPFEYALGKVNIITIND